MSFPDQTPQAPASVQETAANLFDDASNPAVEQAIASAEPTGSTTEPVALEIGIPKVTDFKVPDGGTTHIDAPVTTPAAVVAPTVAPVVTPPQVTTPPQVAPPAAVPPVQVTTPAQPTAEQLAQFHAWQQQQQQQSPVAQAPPAQHPAPAAPPQLTQAEIDHAMNRYMVSQDTFNQLFSETDPVKATALFNEILENKVKQAVTMAHHLIQDSAGQLVAQVRPYMAFADTQREAVLRDQFFISNPDLKGQDLLISTVMAQMTQERQAGFYRPASEQQVFTDVAARTKALIAGMQQQGHVSVNPPQGQPIPVGKPPMAVLPTGGSNGSQSAPNGTAGSGESQTARTIFG